MTLCLCFRVSACVYVCLPTPAPPLRDGVRPAPLSTLQYLWCCAVIACPIVRTSFFVYGRVYFVSAVGKLINGTPLWPGPRPMAHGRPGPRPGCSGLAPFRDQWPGHVPVCLRLSGIIVQPDALIPEQHTLLAVSDASLSLTGQ